MPSLTRKSIADYLGNLFGKEVNVINFKLLGSMEKSEKDVKGYSYGAPVLIEYEVGKKPRKAVLTTQTPSPFGHDFSYDRAAGMLESYDTFNKLPRHKKAIGVGSFLKDGTLVSLNNYDEFFIVTDFVEGEEYYLDLERIRDSGQSKALDMRRAMLLSDYLVSIHKNKKEAPELYTRRVRDLVGHGECIMGLIDNYPDKFEFIDSKLLSEIEKKCVDWRWILKKKTYRLSTVHGDFHPWNILFCKGGDFTVLDRSRGEWGEPADDVSAMSINYIFFSLQRYEKLKDPFLSLYKAFMDNYLSKTNDKEMLEVIQPFYAWRGLVIGSPIWYPNMPKELRRKLFNFILNVLDAKKFNPMRVNNYLEA